MMTPLSRLLPPLPGFTALSRTYAPWPVWTGSPTTPIRFAPMAKKGSPDDLFKIVRLAVR
jgi:hypothetical protein